MGNLVMRSFLLVIMVGVLGIYGLFNAVIIYAKMGASYSFYCGYVHLGISLIVGMTSLGAGHATDVLGGVGVRMNSKQLCLLVGLC